jgi:hypothetical protein
MKMRICESLCVGMAAVAVALTGTTPPAEAQEGNPFGVTSFTIATTRSVERVEGEERVLENIPTPFTQAGGHLDGHHGGADSLTTVIRFENEPIGTDFSPTREVKDAVVSLPPGLLGDPMAVPRCSLTQLLGRSERCPADTQIGVARIQLGLTELLGPVVNVIPEAGQSAEFGVENPQKLIFLEKAHLVRTADGYGFTVVSNDIPTVNVTEVEETIWGVPGDPSHDPARGLLCQLANGVGLFCSQSDRELKLPGSGDRPFGLEQVPFLTMPTNCAAGPETAELRADSWEEPGSVGVNQKYEGYVKAPADKPLPTVAGAQTGFTGCDVLKFEPGIETRPDSLLADEPVGLGVRIQVPQPEEPSLPGTPHLRDSVVTLPPGMSISPGAVDGIQACQATGPDGINITGPESEEVGANGELRLAPGHCPNASTVGTAEAITPLLPEPVKGHVYLAKPGCGGAGQTACTEQDALNGNLYRMYLELGGSGPLAKAGIEIKVEGQIDVNPATGQITAKFLENPQAPFSELVVHLDGGPRASLANPATCGRATTTTDFTPWSRPGETPEGLLVAGTPDATPSSFFEVGGCPEPTPFNPGFTAGTVTPQAGQFSNFTMALTRQDREQFVKGLQIHTPPGVGGMLANVPLCDGADANAGTCSESSKIGTTRVATGAGSHPFEIEGDIYLTGPHCAPGASAGHACGPFGLSIVVHLIAGPFNLGIKVVRARIAVDVNDSTVTVATDEAGPYSIPQIVFGVPVRLRRVTVALNRAGFMFNPTNCKAQQIAASVVGSQGAVANTSSPFAAGGCKSLAFAPKFTASTNAHTSRSKGANLDTKLVYPANAMGNDANIARVKVSLPRQLPSRLTTLQQACPANVFEANPANCPAASIVGVARASTPILPVGVAGPVYFVSHGGEQFPSLVIVLQGDGVRVDLTGTTFIDKQGITSSTFTTIPDVPVSTFELSLPQDRFSALAANGNLCSATRIVTVKRKVTRHRHGHVVRETVNVRQRKRGMALGTELVAQNGLAVRQETKLVVNGCGTSGTASTASQGRGTSMRGSRTTASLRDNANRGRAAK